MNIATQFYKPADCKPIGAMAKCRICGTVRRIDGAARITLGAYGRRERFTYFPQVDCCGKSFNVVLREIHGHQTNQPCDARCMGATGPNCDCSCGGRNHGSAVGPR